MAKLELYSEIHGDTRNRPVVILHGLFGSSGNWRSIARLLANHYSVHCLDMRNHGNSPWADTMTYPEMAGDVVQYLDSHQLEKPHLIGHSMGGKTLMAIMQMTSQPIGRCIVIDIAPVLYQHNHDTLIDAMQAMDLPAVKSRTAADELLAKDVESRSVRQFLLQNLVRDGGKYRWRINLDAISSSEATLFDYPDGPVCEHPVFFISGTESDYIKPEYAPEISRIFPNFAMQEISGAGHWVHAEEPQKLLECIRSDLSRH